jgi:hypothetical protein
MHLQEQMLRHKAQKCLGSRNMLNHANGVSGHLINNARGTSEQRNFFPTRKRTLKEKIFEKKSEECTLKIG